MKKNNKKTQEEADLEVWEAYQEEAINREKFEKDYGFWPVKKRRFRYRRSSSHGKIRRTKPEKWHKLCKRCNKTFEATGKYTSICEACVKPHWRKNEAS